LYDFVTKEFGQNLDENKVKGIFSALKRRFDMSNSRIYS